MPHRFSLLLSLFALNFLTPGRGAFAADPPAAARVDPDIARAQAEDAEVTRVIGSDARIATLPKGVTDVYIDSSGEAWFTGDSAPYGGSERSLRVTLEAALAGKSRVIRGGHPILRDRKGRLWVHTFQNKLLAFDGKQWLEHQATEPQPDKKNAGWGVISRQGWEDQAGNVYFIGLDQRGYGIHRLTTDDKWEYQNVTSKADAPNCFLSYVPVVVVAQDGGRFTLCAERGRPDPSDRVQALHFDGKSWRMLNPSICKAGHDVDDVIPLPDGGIGTICRGDPRRLWTYWPDGAAGGENRIVALMNRLDADNPTTRDRATASLVAMGPGIANRLRAALENDAPSPEAQARLRMVLASAAAVEKDAKGEHEHGMLYGGRFTFDTAYLASRSHDGRTVFYVEGLVDHPAGKTYPQALLTASLDGTWALRPVDGEQWGRTGGGMPSHLFEDDRGRLYLHGGVRVNEQAKLERVADFGFNWDHILGQDKRGRIYAQAKGLIYVVNEAATAAKPGLNLTQYNAMSFRGFRKDGTVMAQFVDGSNERLMHFTNGKWNPIKGLPRWDLEGFYPMARGAALVQSDGGAHLFDGKQWQDAKTMEALVERNPKIFQAIAGNNFASLAEVRVATNEASHVWLYHFTQKSMDDEGRLTQPADNHFSFYDGKRWHNVWKETGMTAISADPFIGAAEKGRVILMMNDTPDKGFTEFRFDGSAVRATKVQSPPFRFDSRHYGISAGGRMWFGAFPDRILTYADGKIIESTQKGTPLYCDTAGRLWSLSARADALEVNDGKASAKATIAGLAVGAGFLETRDGRLLLFHTQALSELALDATSGGLAIREVRRWPWGAPKTTFETLIEDAEGGIWFAGGPNQMMRFVLPPAGK